MERIKKVFHLILSLFHFQVVKLEFFLYSLSSHFGFRVFHERCFVVVVDRCTYEKKIKKLKIKSSFG
jgi:hypothetical protein